MSKPLEILFFMKSYVRVRIFTKIICIWKSYFWKKRLLMFTNFALFYRNPLFPQKYLATVQYDMQHWREIGKD